MKSYRTRIIILSIVFVIIELIFSFVLMPELKEISGQTMMDMQFYHNGNFYDILSDYGSEGMKVYNQLQVLDLFFPLVYGLLFYNLYRWKQLKYTFLPLMTMAFDYTENIGIRLLIAFPNPSLPSLVFVFTALKFICFTGLFVYIIATLLKRRLTPNV